MGVRLIADIGLHGQRRKECGARMLFAAGGLL